MIRTIAAAFATSRLDYANSVLYGIPPKYISHLQHTQNTLARVVAGNRTPCSNLATLSQLHWFPINDRIKFKIATMTHKARTTPTPGPLIHSVQNSKVCLCQPSLCYLL